MNQLVKPLRSGQITIPAHFREKLGLDSDTLLQMSLVEGELRMKPIRITTSAKDTFWFKKLYDQFSKTRKEARIMPEKEIDKSIDKALKAVRKSHA